MANFCSIEMEPRTLNRGQLNYAREIAVDIVQKKETRVEPSSIFSEALKPIAEIKETVVVVVSDTNPPQKAMGESGGDVVKIESTNVGTCCQCSCTNAVVVEDELVVKEPVSAPF